MIASLLPLLTALATPALAAPPFDAAAFVAMSNSTAGGAPPSGGQSIAPQLGTGVQQKCGQEIYAAYWRTWNDATTGFDGMQARMDSLPKGTDIALVFDAEGADKTDYFRVLKEKYVPALHAQGTRLARSLGTHVVHAIPVPASGDYDQVAQDLIAQYVTPWGLDGLDFDVEEELSPAQVDHFAGVIRALAKYLGPQGKEGSLLIYDTNQDGDTPLFARVADVISYVFVQAYGRSGDGMQATWASYAPHIDSCRFLPGFSFYEERGAHWGDTQKPFDTSLAGQYAKWQPEGGQKGGVFSYAADRDWKDDGDDSITEPTYEFAHEIFKVQGKE